MQLTFEVKPAWYPATVQWTLRLFRAGAFVATVESASPTCAIEPGRFLEPDTRYGVFWYVRRKFQDGRHTDVTGQSGGSSKVDMSGHGMDSKLELEEETQTRAGTGSFRLGGGSFIISDIDGVTVATLVVANSTMKPVERVTSKSQTEGGGGGAEWQKKVEAATPQETNITELPRHIFAAVEMPFATIPIWGYTLAAQRRASQRSTGVVSTLKRVFDQACWLMRVSDFGKSSLDKQLEVVCEMQSMATRFLVYVRDVSMRLKRDVMVDDWTFLEDWPSPKLAEFDCEDGAVHALGQSLMLQAATGLTGDLGEAQTLERNYYSCFAVVTLRLGNTDTHVYHAVLMKIDRSVVNRKLGIPTVAETKDVLPTVLVETTAWSTSNWRYSTKNCTPKHYDTVATRIDVNTKVCAETIKEQKLYGHLCSLVIPELTMRKQLGQIQISANGKFGADVSQAMESFDGIKFHPVYTDSKTVDALSETTSQLLPESPMLLASDTAPLKLSQRPTEAPRAEFCVRGHDWDQYSKQVMRVAAEMGKRVETQVIDVYGGIGGVVVSVY